MKQFSTLQYVVFYVTLLKKDIFYNILNLIFHDAFFERL